MNTFDTPANAVPEPAEPALEAFVMDAMVWYCVKALIAPLWTPVKGTAPVTSFDYSKVFKALHEKEGRPAVLGGSGRSTHDLVAAQARRMLLEHARQLRLAEQEEERQRRDAELKRQALEDAEAVGDFGL